MKCISSNGSTSKFFTLSTSSSIIFRAAENIEFLHTTQNNQNHVISIEEEHYYIRININK